MICGLSNWIVNISLCELYISRAYSNSPDGQKPRKAYCNYGEFLLYNGIFMGRSAAYRIFLICYLSLIFDLNSVINIRDN